MRSIQRNDEISPAAYQILSIAQTTAPSDSDGTWFRYVIVQGTNEITGLRAGSAQEVEVAVRAMVEGLNQRSRGHHVKKAKPEPVPGVQTIPDQTQQQP